MLTTDLTLPLPGLLFLLAGVILLAAAYLWSQRRKRKFALRYSSLALIRPALIRQPRLRHHIPPMLFFLSLSSLAVAQTRPTATLNSQTAQSTIILVMDVSGSMLFDDIAPNRLKAAESAALFFIGLQKQNTRIGIVQFSSHAELIMPPTSDHDRLRTAINSLTTGEETAIGNGIFTALKTIADDRQGRREKGTQSKRLAQLTDAYAPEIIILLTDGISSVGPPPLQAAQKAAEQGVRVYAIGFGSHQNQIPAIGMVDLSNPEIDEDTLKQIAALTGGSYYAPASAGGLKNVFASLSTSLSSRRETQEISVVFTALGALLAFAAMGLSLLWHPLP